MRNHEYTSTEVFSAGLFWGAIALKCIQIKFGIL
jgi:hypothetical protein